MPTLNKGTNWGVGASDTSNQQTSQSKTYTFQTAGTYVDRNIAYEVKVPGIILETPSAGKTTTFYLQDALNTWHWEIDPNGNVLIY